MARSVRNVGLSVLLAVVLIGAFGADANDVLPGPRFNQFQAGESDGVTSTILHIKINGRLLDAGKQVTITWKKPPDGTGTVEETTIVLDENGDAAFDWNIPIPSLDGEFDTLLLTDQYGYPMTPPGGQPGYWNADKQGTHRMPRREGPTLSEWGVIVLILLMAGTSVVLLRRRQRVQA